MYVVSQRYKEMMRAKIRECQAMARIYMGVFDPTANADATFSFPESTEFSVPENVYKDIQITAEYATFEGQRLRLDQTQLILPKEKNAYRAQGWVSKALSNADGEFDTPQEVNISFGGLHSMVGLTFNFGEIEEDIPKQITVLAYNNDELVSEQVATDNISLTYRWELFLENINKIKLRFDKTQGPYQRARLNKLEFGIGYVFQNKEIIKIQENHSYNPVSTSLPFNSATFSISNADKRFQVLGQNSITRFLLENQEVTIDYGVNLGTGEEWILGWKWILQSWSVNETEADFSVTDRLTQLTKSTYQTSVYDFSWHYMKEYAEKVFADAGVPASDYYIDPAINSFYSMAPIPIVSHAEALQIIANRSCSDFFVGRKGIISLKRLTISPKFSLLAQSESSRYTYYSDTQSVLNGTSKDYATFEPDYFRLDGSMRILPDGTGKVEGSGMTGKLQSLSNGLFDSNGGLIWVAFSNEPMDVYSITVNFGGQIPQIIGISCYSEGKWNPSQWIYPTKNIETFQVNYQHITGYQVMIYKMRTGGCRGHFNSVSVSNLSDMKLNREDVFSNLNVEIGERLKNVTTQWVERSYWPTIEQEVAYQKVKTNSGWAYIPHELCYAPQASISDTSVTIEQKNYAFASYVKLTSSTDKDVDVTIKGKKISESNHPIVSVGNPGGEDIEVSNPLLDSVSSQKVLDYMRDYYLKRTKVTADIRGYPEIECGDYIMFEDEPMQVLETKLTFNGAFRETLVLKGS